MFAGCSSNSESSAAPASAEPSAASEETAAVFAPEPTATAAPQTQESSTPEESTLEEPAHTISYPLGQQGETITFWTTIPGNQTDIFPNGYNDHFLINDVEEALGVDLDIISVPQIAMGDTTDFDLMIASGDWPDLLNVTGYKGGLTQAYSDEIILELTDEMLSEYAPAYYSLLMAQTPENIRATQTEGAYYALYGITKGEGASASRGMVIRTDWLSELNMDMPSTVEELTEILKAFKRTYNPQYPYFIEADADLVYMCAAFNTDTVGYYNDGALPVYRDGDEVKVAWATNEYRKFLEWFNECYQEGIFEPSFYSTASDQAGDRYSNLINGQIGVYEDSPTSIADWKQYALNGETVEVSFFPNLVDENGNNTWGEEQQVLFPGLQCPSQPPARILNWHWKS